MVGVYSEMCKIGGMTQNFGGVEHLIGGVREIPRGRFNPPSQ
jgi:hypothetical protein